MTHLSFRIDHKAATGSTNDDVLAAAAIGESEGLVVIADRQGEGRGRRGRSWASPPGNLYASLLLRPSVHDPALYGFVTSLAIAQALSRDFDPQRIRLKWPNDVLVDGKKISGILLESRDDALIVGFGVNIVSHPSEARYPATSLIALGHHDPERLSPRLLLDKILTQFAVCDALFRSHGFAPVREAWMARASNVGEQIVARLPDRELTGIFHDIDASGHLLLRDGAGMIASIAAGDVFPLRMKG